MIAFIPLINGLGFTYIGAKKFENKWIYEGLIYEIPWFLEFLFINHDSIATLFAGIGLIGVLISIIRAFWVYSKRDELLDNDSEDYMNVRKTSGSLWTIFSIIIFLNGIGLIIVGLRRNVQRWIIEGAFFELLWVLYFILFDVSEGLMNFLISLALMGWILSIVRTFMVYFEEKRMDAGFIPSPEPKTSPSTENIHSKPVETVANASANSDIIPQFRPYMNQIDGLKINFNKKEENIADLINKRFEKQELSYDRFMSVIDNCHKLFYHQADSASNIIHLAPEYSIRLDESIKEKISIMQSIIDEMNHLIEELIIHDGDDESDEDLKELFSNMDNLINSVKDYK